VASQYVGSVIRRPDDAMMGAMAASPHLAQGSGRPRFDITVPDSAYRWWYVDGISDDGQLGIVVIAFIGSVFSPYYFRARDKGPADPLDYCAINVGLYNARNKLWAMTERGRDALDRGVDWFRVGPSSLHWHDDRLEIEIRERSMPLARRIQGKVVVRPKVLNARCFPLDAGRRHCWQPYAPSAHIDVQMSAPSYRWQGHGYFDTNNGERALEDDFKGWDWSRGERPSGTSISYAVTQLDGTQRALALHFGHDGQCREVAVPAAVELPRTRWRIGRLARTAGHPVVSRTLEDTPFYARSALAVRESDGDRLVMHESLDLMRFRSAWVRFLLPFRMPRIA
jgi:carotenoid 1,2-hydratase